MAKLFGSYVSATKKINEAETLFSKYSYIINSKQNFTNN